VLVPELAVGSVDFEDGMAPLAQEAVQAGAVRPRALDPEGADRSQRPRPGLKHLVALAVDRDGHRAEAGAERVDRHGGVGKFVGVDADNDFGGYDLAHGVVLQAGWWA